MQQHSAQPVALVTGASAGIGEATVRAFLGAGMIVYAAARRTERMASLGEAGARILTLDVTDDAAMTAAMAQIESEAGRLDVLVNNAGYGSYGALEDVPLDEARRQFEVNVFGAARLAQLALPMMRAQHSGTIVNVSSIGGKIHTPFGGWYHATKFALEGLSNSLRMEVAPFGIRVVVIEPGAIKTEWGGIAVGSLLERSGASAYAAQATQFANMLNNGSSHGSKPAVVANTILRATRARNPGTRYATGSMAKPILFLRSILPDRAFDALIRSAMRSGG